MVVLFKDTGVNAFLVTDETNVSWLTGFTGDSSWLLVASGKAFLLSDSRYETQIAEECPGLEAMIRRTDQRLTQVCAEAVSSLKVKRLGVEGHVMTLEAREALAAVLGPVELVPISMRIETELRSIKDAEEIAETRQAVMIAGRGFDFLRATLRADQTERDIAYELEHAMRKIGAASVSFPAIIGSGDRAAIGNLVYDALRRVRSLSAQMESGTPRALDVPQRLEEAPRIQQVGHRSGRQHGHERHKDHGAPLQASGRIAKGFRNGAAHGLNSNCPPARAVRPAG